MTQLRVVVITSNASGNAARVCHHLARSVDGITLVGALVDAGTTSDRRRQLRRLRAWQSHGGSRYVLWRCWLEARDKVRPQIRAQYVHTLGHLGEMYGFPVIQVPNINGTQARDSLAGLNADLGVSVGNRVIQESTFAIPRLGMVNLHHGRIPDFRGGPPGFWEMYDQVPVMGVSVHRIDAELDHGELLGAAEFAILDRDDPRTLMERAYTVDVRLMGEVVGAISKGSNKPIAVDFGARGVRTIPSRAQVRALEARLGRPVRHDDFRRARLPPLPDAPP